MTQLIYNCGDKQFNITLPDHRRSHEWQNGIPGSDAVNIYPRMFALLRTTVYEGVLVKVSPFYYKKNGEIIVFTGSSFNTTSYVPSTANYVRLIIIGLDTDSNTIVAYSGTETLDSIITLPPLPNSLPDTFIPSALIKLRANTTVVNEIDITDARMFLSLSGGGASAWPRPGKVNIGNTEYATLAAAAAAAVSGDVLKMGEGTFTESVSLPNGVKLRGSGVGLTILTYGGAANTLTLVGTATIENITVNHTAGWNSLTNSSTVTLRRVKTNATTQLGVNSVVDLCDLASGGFLTVAGTGIVITGGTAGILYLFSGSVTLKGVQIGSTFASVATINAGSWYFDADGLKHEVGSNITGHRIQDSANGPIRTVKDNFGAIIAPSVTDDVNSNYEVGSTWYDTVAKIVYLCWDAAAGAAVWQQMGSSVDDSDLFLLMGA